jgi:ribose transport system permease protein
VYIVSGICAGIGGYLSLALYQQTTIAGNSLTNLAVIAGVVIGGTSLFGGVGMMFGTVIGLLIPVTLRQGFVISGVQAFWQEVVVGMFLIGAVYVDGVRRARATRRSGKKPKGMTIGGLKVGSTEKEGDSE